MSFQQVFKFGHLDHLLAKLPRGEAILAICQPATTHCPLSVELLLQPRPFFATNGQRCHRHRELATVATLPATLTYYELRPPPTATSATTHESPPPPPPRHQLSPNLATNLATNLAKPPRELASLVRKPVWKNKPFFTARKPRLNHFPSAGILVASFRPS